MPYVSRARLSVSTTLVAGLLGASMGCSHRPTVADPSVDGSPWVIEGATLLASPDDSPIVNARVVIRGDRIVATGSAAQVKLPKAPSRVVDGAGSFLVAGFQNSHVHFTEPKWADAAAQPAAQLTEKLQDMLLRYGFTTVVDAASSLQDTLALRARIESGEVIGPRIYTAGAGLYPHKGIPFYLRNSLPPEILAVLPDPATPKEAASYAAGQLDRGADIVKLFTGSWVKPGKVLPMSAAVAQAAAREAHDRGRLVFSHASNVAGLEVALAAKVDVLAHALDDDRGFDEGHVARMKAAKMAMIPTLKLFGGKPYTKFIQALVGQYAKAGGVILFGTDVGFLTDYDPTEEYVLMAGAGLDWRQILRALTVAPAKRFGEGEKRGRVAAKMSADLVILERDPSVDVTAFAQVRLAVRGGRIVYEKTTP